MGSEGAFSGADCVMRRKSRDAETGTETGVPATSGIANAVTHSSQGETVALLQRHKPRNPLRSWGELGE